jgi:segregation and condensation protein B
VTETNPRLGQPEPADTAAGSAPDALFELRSAADISGPLEALLLLADEPVNETTLAQALDVPTATVAEALTELVAFYDETGRGFELRHLGGGWRYYTREEHADVIAAFVLEGQQSRLSPAALETLAVITYQQPISRARVSAVRGVNVDGVIRTLLARGLLEEAGTDVDSGAALFRTTNYFLERMGLASLDDLPDLAPHLPEVEELEAELSQLAVAETAAQAEIHEPNEPEKPGDPEPAGDPEQPIEGQR